MTGFQKSMLLVGAGLAGLLVYFLSPILTPFLLGALFAYLGNPLANRLVKWHLPRTLAVTLVFMFIFAVVLGLIMLLVPVLQNQIILLVSKIPKIVAWVQSTVIPWIQTNWDINISSFNIDWSQTGQVASRVLKTLSVGSMAVMSFLITVVLTPVVTFYLLRDWPKVVNNTHSLVPRKYAKTARSLVNECDEVLGAFFKGQLLVMLALGVIYSAGLALIGVDLALLIGVLIAILSIVPYLGTVVGLLIAVTVALFQFHAMMPVVYIIALFIIGHILEGMVLAPLLIGDRIGLHPVAVIFAILAGGQLFGFIGILLALPVAAVIMVWVRYIHQHYLNSRFYK